MSSDPRIAFDPDLAAVWGLVFGDVQMVPSGVLENIGLISDYRL